MKTNPLLNSIWKDWTIRLCLGTLALVWTLYAVGTFTSNDLAVSIWYHSHLALLAIVLYGFQKTLRATTDKAQQRFWQFLTLAFSLWLGVRVLFLAGETGTAGALAFFFGGVLYVGFFLAFLLAVDSRPDAPAPDERLTLPRRLEAYATVVFTLGVLTYFILLPHALYPNDPEMKFLWGTMMVGLDIALLYRLVSALRNCKSQRWLTVYSLLAGAVILWLPGDVLDLLPETASGEQPLIFDLFYDAGLLITLAAASAYRLHPAEADEESTDDEDVELFADNLADNVAVRLTPNRNLILVYAIALPIMHGALTALGWLHADFPVYREAVVVLFLLALGTMAFIERREIERVSGLIWQREFENRSRLERDESRFRDLFENSNDLIQSVRADGSFEYVNPAWHKALGYSAEDLPHLHFMSLIAPEERAHCQRIFTGLQGGESFAHVSTVFTAKSGRRVHVEGSISAHMRLGNFVATRGFFQDVTSRRKAEDARNVSDARFRVLFDHSPDGLVIVNEYGLIVRTNPETDRMFGYEPGELNGKTVESLIPSRFQGGHISKRLNYFDNPVARPINSGVELSALRKDGTEFPVEIALGPFETETGTLVTATIIDVTKSKAARDALKASEERYRELVERSPGFIGKHDMDGVILSVNPALSHNLGYEPKDMVGRKGADFLSARGKDMVGQYGDRVRREGSATGLVEMVTRDDEVRIWEYRCVLHDEPGEESFVMGYAQDVTDRHRAERALRKLAGELEQRVDERTRELGTSETKLLEAQRIAKMGSWEWDVETNVTRRSAEIYRIFGVSPEEMEATREGFFHYVHEDDREMIHKEVTAVQEGEKEGFEIRFRITRPDGKVRWLHSSAEVVARTHGVARRLAGVTQDITEQRDLQDRLQQTQKVEMLGRLAGGVAHDFNNLLMVIGGHAEMLREQLNSPGIPTTELEEIQKAVDQASSLTQQLLAFSRPQPHKVRTLDLGETLDNMRGMLQRLLGERYRIEFHCANDVWPVKSDPTQMQQVIMNLVTNARDAQPAGGTIFVEAVNRDLTARNSRLPEGLSPGHYVVVSVRDDGIGMDADTRVRIFDPFYTTKVTGKGTGLGLAMVRGIIQQLNGVIEVDSEPGKGTAFHLYWPRAEKSLLPEELGTAETSAEGGSEVILLVEDEAGVRRLARGYLESQGYTVLEAEDGADGLEMAKQYVGHIDLLLSDVVMPRMSGPAMVEELARLRPDLQVIFMSGYADDAILDEGGLPSDSAVLPKPFTLAELGQRVREALDARDRAPDTRRLVS